MSALISSDAPLTSPVSDCSWDQQPFYSPTQMESFPFNYQQYSQPPSPPYSTSSAATGSPVPAERMLKMRMTPDYSSDHDSQLCLPTHQVFEIPPAPETPPSPVSPQPQSAQRYAPLPASSALKRPSSPTPSSASVSKKPRASGERISAKDFIPPDVSGLSKREARLVKNRAAAFLSRQRKREEFENMEIRVAELEQENSRLQAIAQAAPTPQEEVQMLSEIDQLRAQLAAAEERERQLSSQLLRRPPAVKLETADPRLPTSPSRPMSFHKTEKTSASLSLLVLLCALPSIFSMSAQSHPALPMTGSFPVSNVPSNPFGASKFDFNSYLPADHDWRMPSNAMDLDRASSQGNAASRKLEFVDADATALGLGGLDISFDAEPSENGKIRVRIHHPSASTSPSPSSSSSYGSMSISSSPQFGTFNDPSAWNFNLPSNYHPNMQPMHMRPAAPQAPPQFEADPFLGVGIPMPELPYGMDAAMLMGVPSESNIDTAFGKRRVRIALKSMPTAGTDGGEWEVELC